jgi:hypothetical protein
LKLPVDEVVRGVAEARHVVLVIGQPQVHAGDVAVGKCAQRAAAVVQFHNHMIAC